MVRFVLVNLSLSILDNSSDNHHLPKKDVFNLALTEPLSMHSHPPPLIPPPYRDAVALSDVPAEDAGHHAAEGVQHWHAEAPAEVRGRLTLHAGEAEKGAAALGAEGTRQMNNM